MREQFIIETEMNLMEKMIECVNSVPLEIDLTYNYICIQTVKGNMNVRVDKVFIDGYESEGVYYPFTPFRAVDPVDYEMMVKNEKRILALVEKQRKEQKEKSN